MNIVLQHWTGELDELGILSSANISAYAERLGADYKLLRGNVFSNNLAPPCQKLHMLSEEFDSYDQVLMLDMDMFAVKGLAENVFDVPGTGLFSEFTKKMFARCIEHHQKMCDPSYAYWGGAIYKMDRERRQALRKHIPDSELLVFSRGFNDEGMIHHLCVKAKIKQDRMPDKWCQCSYLPNPENAAMIHIRVKIGPHGPRRPKIENYMALRHILE